MNELQNFINQSLGIRENESVLNSTNAIWDDGEWVSWADINRSLDENHRAEKYSEDESMSEISTCILVDYENVQKLNLDSVDHNTSIVKIFVGKSQNKIPFELVEKLQRFGENGEWIKIEGSGPNALDFHISFSLGLLCGSNRDMKYIVISKDTGFDPLIKYLNANEIDCKRLPDIEVKSGPKQVISKPKIAEKPTDSAQFVLDRLRNAPKPRTEKTLKNAMKSLFGGTATEKEINDAYTDMIKRGMIKLNQNKLQYLK